jgi:hypothetical protein
MSDESIITVTTLVIGFLSMWLKLHYSEKKVEQKVDKAAGKAAEAASNAQRVEHKIDDNTALTRKIDGQTNGGLDDRFSDHARRIAALEATVAGVKTKVDGVEAKVDGLGKNIDSTRHEFRGYFGIITNNLSILSGVKAIPIPLPAPPTPIPPTEGS